MTTTSGIQVVIDSVEEIPNNANIEINEITICRICMEPQLEDSDPIMSLGCNCRHNLGQAHKKCLIKWFCQQRYKSMMNFDGLPSYKNCEICKKILSPSIQGLINVHWRPFFEEEMKKNMLRGYERRIRRQVRMTWKDIAYVILGAIVVIGLTCSIVAISIFFQN